MLPFPLNASFQRMQPLVMLDERVLAMSRGPQAAVLRTAAGVQHRLGVLAPLRTIWANAVQRMLLDAERELIAIISREASQALTEPLAYFLHHLVPSFGERDVSESACQQLSLNHDIELGDWSVEATRAAVDLPAPRPPMPSLWFCGRIWLLERQAPQRGQWQVLARNDCLGLTGEYMLVGSLASKWQLDVKSHLTDSGVRIARNLSSQSDPTQLGEARHVFEKAGVVERGDLLLLHGVPPRLGYVIPRHYNHVLGGDVNRTLAMTAPLTFPPQPYPSVSSLQIYRRGVGWQLYSPPHGLCLGPSAPMHSHESAGVGLAAFLRWAAQRIAQNGAFHSSDGIESNDYDYH